MSAPTSLERQSLEAHVDLCALRYENLENKFEIVDRRLEVIEKRIEDIHITLKEKDGSLVKVIIGATATIVAGVLSTLVVILMKFS